MVVVQEVLVAVVVEEVEDDNKIGNIIIIPAAHRCGFFLDKTRALSIAVKWKKFLLIFPLTF